MTRSAEWDNWIAKAKAVDIANVVAARGGLGLKQYKRELIGACPRCGGEDRFSVSTKSGKQVFNCRGCGAKGDAIALTQFLDGCDFEHAVEKLTGQPKPERPKPKPNGHAPGDKLGKLVAEYPYVDESDELLFQVVRFDPKAFRQRRPNGHGGWIWNVDGVRMVPFHLPQLLEAVASEHPVVVVEGEKDVLTAAQLGLVATTSPGGVGKGWRAEYDRHFAAADVVVVPDDDADGKGAAHARTIAEHLQKVARRVRIVTLPDAKDLTAWVERGGTREQFDKLAEDTRTMADATRKFEQQTNQPVELFDPWARYVVPPFPVEVLPPTLRHFVTAQSELIGCERGALAMTVLAAVSGALDHRFALKLLRNGDWWVSPRLWVLLVGDPSVKKTPIIRCATEELDRMQAAAFRKYKDDRSEYLAADGNPEQFRAPPPRLTVYDTTVEKLGMILAEQDRGVLIKRDEIAGWIGSMEKYAGGGRGSASDRAFWLQAYDGGPYSVDRVTRPDLQITNLSASIIGGIQPARLAELQGLASDGLLQRFLPVLVSASTFPTDTSASIYADRYASLLHHLVELAPQKLLLSDDAVTLMGQLRRDLFDLEQNASGLTAGFATFVGKLAGDAGTLVLILTMAAEPDRPPSTTIGPAVVEDVAALIKGFVLPNALEFYASGASGGERLRTLGKLDFDQRQNQDRAIRHLHQRPRLPRARNLGHQSAGIPARGRRMADTRPARTLATLVERQSANCGAVRRPRRRRKSPQGRRGRADECPARDCPNPRNLTNLIRARECGLERKKKMRAKSYLFSHARIRNVRNCYQRIVFWVEPQPERLPLWLNI